jgi:flavodoxin
MKRVLIAYFSLTGKTEKMAEYIGEGVRFSGNEAVVKKISEFKKADDLNGYDGYLFGCATYFQDIAEPMRTFLFLAKKAALKGKLAGAFGTYLHDVGYTVGGQSTAVIMDTMQYIYQMEAFGLGPLKVKEPVMETPEGMRTCQDYGKVFGETLGS